MGALELIEFGRDPILCGAVTLVTDGTTNVNNSSVAPVDGLNPAGPVVLQKMHELGRLPIGFYDRLLIWGHRAGGTGTWGARVRLQREDNGGTTGVRPSLLYDIAIPDTIAPGLTIFKSPLVLGWDANAGVITDDDTLQFRFEIQPGSADAVPVALKFLMVPSGNAADRRISMLV